MKSTELQDEAMDMIVGGGSYIRDLAEFIQRSPSAEVYFSASAGSPSNASTSSSATQGSMTYPANDKGMESLIQAAATNGTITIYTRSGAKKTFTSDQLSALL